MAADKYVTEFDGEVVHINSRLVESRGITDDTLEKIKESHRTRIRIFHDALKTDDIGELRKLAGEFDELEYYQQELWGFPRNASFHRWFDFPKCTCPKMDNADRLGTPYQVIAQDCPIHGASL